jgi:hypothetical protein
MKIIAMSDVRTAKDGRNYFVAEFRPSLGQRVVKRTFWEQFVRDAKTQVVDKTKKFWERMSPTECKEAIASGEAIIGEKITHTVEPYELGDKLVDSYSTVIFPDENAYTLFANQNHPIVDADGVIHKKKAVLAPNGAVKSVETVNQD